MDYYSFTYLEDRMVIMIIIQFIQRHLQKFQKCWWYWLCHSVIH